jgi:hypothetical protein
MGPWKRPLDCPDAALGEKPARLLPCRICSIQFSMPLPAVALRRQPSRAAQHLNSTAYMFPSGRQRAPQGRGRGLPLSNSNEVNECNYDDNATMTITTVTIKRPTAGWRIQAITTHPGGMLREDFLPPAGTQRPSTRSQNEDAPHPRWRNSARAAGRHNRHRPSSGTVLRHLRGILAQPAIGL